MLRSYKTDRRTSLHLLTLVLHYTLHMQASGSVASPRAVQREAVLLNYVVDCHLDATIKTMIIEQCSHQPLAKNPFFDCTRHLRASMWMMELCSNSDKQICKEMYVYHVCRHKSTYI